MKKIVLSIILFIFSIFLHANVITSTNTDIDNDGILENITLEGNKLSEIYYDAFVLKIKNEKSEKNIKLDFGGYSPKMEIYDFDGDSIKDILIISDSGGSGNYSEYFIYSIKKGVLLNNDLKLDLKAKFFDGFKALISYKDKYTFLDLSEKKEQYINEKIYNKFGQFIGENKDLFIGGISNLEAFDFGKDDIYELKGIITLSGIYHADRIGYIHFVYSIKNDKFIWLEVSKLLYAGF
ncbi:hypothetical protein H17ap60334_06886 [Thermosipho africanus H17ap60334]|jgi:hypothetical protein|uniref:VCBS repeat-containing protein n=1 Tax=Thermosipho africanus (strain TCF52B) TaxID=484019 RepID=B7IE95_THEAB|nr:MULTISPECIES: hypothetical protein [Thermosipho]HCF38526.1 hypothetical protein [Thermosipho africanus]ACJ76322.1 conserved hypothetical protein [Thermosipho africanus TCF52B]EKF49201.1 hypothetical protein H17ap60334_06886 [Thermosipho africanus H17ap60334]MBZ4650348.1 hypothetical protein [Thermosipho sp. (in: thermotogales)]MDK2840256.1 hypothetical protein [Thermosipho sp. (in: thermotogales)]